MGLVAPIWVSLARGRFAAKAQLMRVGFSWVSLDSLVRIETYQWVTRLEAGKTFFFPGVRSAGTGASVPRMRRRRIVHRASLNLVSDFLQEIVVRPIFLRPVRSLQDFIEAPRSEDAQGGRSIVVALPDQSFETCRLPAAVLGMRSSLRWPISGSADRRDRADFRLGCDSWPGRSEALSPAAAIGR
jgi:hypothetical protein